MRTGDVKHQEHQRKVRERCFQGCKDKTIVWPNHFAIGTQTVTCPISQIKRYEFVERWFILWIYWFSKVLFHVFVEEWSYNLRTAASPAALLLICVSVLSLHQWEACRSRQYQHWIPRLWSLCLCTCRVPGRFHHYLSTRWATWKIRVWCPGGGPRFHFQPQLIGFFIPEGP